MSVPRPNPISTIQATYGLTDVDFAAALDVSVITLRTAKTGRAAYPRAVLGGLVALGHPADQLVAEYQAFRVQARESLLTQIGR